MKIEKISESIEELDVMGQADYCGYDCAQWFGWSPSTPTSGCFIDVSAYN